MLRYYSYYSVGGYKDFMLGTSENKETAKYFLPMLPILEDRAKNDDKSKAKFDELKVLPAIQQLTEDNTCYLPDSAYRLISHAGYKLIYLHLEDNKHALAIRDITPENKDETGRKIPFMFIIMGEDSSDAKQLDAISAYMASNIKTTEKCMSKMLHMDYDKNGLKFEQHQFNEWINVIVKENESSDVLSLEGRIPVNAAPDKVALLVLPKDITLEKAVSELKLDSKEIISVKEPDIISIDDPKKLAETIVRLKEELNIAHKQSETYKKGIFVSAAAGLIVGGLTAYLMCK